MPKPDSMADAVALREQLRDVYRRILTTATKALSNFGDPDTVGRCSAQIILLTRELDKIQETAAEMIGRPLYAELLMENNKLRQSLQHTEDMLSRMRTTGQ